MNIPTTGHVLNTHDFHNMRIWHLPHKGPNGIHETIHSISHLIAQKIMIYQEPLEIKLSQYTSQYKT